MRLDAWVIAVGALFAVLVAFRLGMIAGRQETLANAQVREERLRTAARDEGFKAAQCVGGFKILAAR
jgi:hypothetical protein